MKLRWSHPAFLLSIMTLLPVEGFRLLKWTSSLGEWGEPVREILKIVIIFATYVLLVRWFDRKPNKEKAVEHSPDKSN
jgi:hypothetical protein